MRTSKTVTVGLVGLVALGMLLLAPVGGSGDAELSVHAIRPVGACSSPSNDDSATAFVQLSGTLGSLTYRTNPATYPSNLSAASVESAIDAAFATWETGTDAGDRFAKGLTTSARGGKRDGVNAISWGGANGAVAVAYTWTNSSTGQVVEEDLVFSKAFAWSTNGTLSEDPGAAADDCAGAAEAFDVQAIATHELGHWLRLGHPSNNRQSMYGFVSYRELYKRSLGAGDVGGANERY